MRGDEFMDKNIELYDEEVKVLNRIEKLKELGYDETDMYIITGDENDVSMLRGMTGVIIKEDDDSLWDRFKSFLSGDDSVLDAFSRMDIDEENRDFYYNQVKDGKILLYIDKEYIQYYTLHKDGKFRPIVHPTTPYAPDKQENIEPLPGEELSENVKEDLGVDQKPDPDRLQEKARDELLIEEGRNRLR